MQKQRLMILIGCSGSGKTWVAEQLKDKFHVVHYDQTKKSSLIDVIKSKPLDKPVLLDLPIKISTFIRRHHDDFDIRVVAILGDFLKVKTQILSRKGKITKTLYRRWKVIQKRAFTYAEFTGDSDQVLKYLKNYLWRNLNI